MTLTERTASFLVNAAQRVGFFDCKFKPIRTDPILRRDGTKTDWEVTKYERIRDCGKPTCWTSDKFPKNAQKPPPEKTLFVIEE